MADVHSHKVVNVHLPLPKQLLLLAVVVLAGRQVGAFVLPLGCLNQCLLMGLLFDVDLLLLL